MTTQELSRKWKQKKIANLAYIADECDHIKASERILLYRLIEAIFDEFEADLKLLAATAVSKSESIGREPAVCDHHWLGVADWDGYAMEQCTKCNLFREAN